MSDYRRKAILEAYGKEHGEEIARLAERGGYLFRDALYVGEETIWPRGLDVDSAFPLEARKLGLPGQEDLGMTSFLVSSKPVQDDLKATMASVGEQYSGLVADYFGAKKPRLGAIADLRALRKESTRIQAHHSRRVTTYLERVRCYLAVLFLESRRAMLPGSYRPGDTIPKKIRNAIGGRWIMYRHDLWGSMLFGGPKSLVDANDLRNWIKSPHLSNVLVRIQTDVIYSILEQRDEVITEALPVEFRRMACENILAKIVRGEEVGPWSKKDEERILPPREDFVCQSREARRDIFDLFDFLNEEGHRETEWSHHNEIYQALANKRAEKKPPNISESRYISKEADRLRKAVGRTLEDRNEEHVLFGTSNEQVAKQLRDWLLNAGRSHAPDWRDGVGHS